MAFIKKNHCSAFYQTLAGVLLVGTSCSSIKNSPKYGLGEEVYLSKIDEGNSQQLYLEEQGEVLEFYEVERKDGKWVVPDGKSPLLVIDKTNLEFANQLHLTKKSFDLDLITIPIKYRPAQSVVPSQINSVLNAAAYLGYRLDYYQLDGSATSPLGKVNLTTDHFGVSFGGFLGIGNSDVNEFLTAGIVPIDYQGIVLSKGIAAIFAVNKFTLGLAIGWDNLLDSNRSFWIYQNKPWLGLTIGINLN